MNTDKKRMKTRIYLESLILVEYFINSSKIILQSMPPQYPVAQNQTSQLTVLESLPFQLQSEPFFR